MNTLQVMPDTSFSLNWTASAIFIAVLGESERWKAPSSEQSSPCSAGALCRLWRLVLHRHGATSDRNHGCRARRRMESPRPKVAVRFSPRPPADAGLASRSPRDHASPQPASLEPKLKEKEHGYHRSEVEGRGRPSRAGLDEPGSHGRKDHQLHREGSQKRRT
jgi:hypothetical protein